MATKEKILGTLAAQGSAIPLKQLSTILGEAQGNFFTQLDRMSRADPPLVLKNEDKTWEITDDGRKYLEDSGAGEDMPPPDVLKNSPQPMAVISEYEKFKQLGWQCGVYNKELLKATCDHVWAQDYHDLEVVHAALIQANISPDIAGRWTAFWGSFMKKAIPPELEEKMMGDKVGKGGVVTEGRAFREKLTHIIDQSTGLPVWVGPGYGDLTYEDANRMSQAYLGARARAPVPAAPAPQQESSIDQAIKIVELINAKKEEGTIQPNKNYMVKLDEDGNPTMEEYDSGKPLLVNAAPAHKNATPTGLSAQVNEIKDFITGLASLGLVKLPGSEPPALATQQQKIFFVNAEGQLQEYTPGQPIIIRQPQQPAVPAPVNRPAVTIENPDGSKQQVTPDNIDLVIKMYDLNDRRRREEDSHKTRTEIAQSFKDLLGKASRVAERLATKPEE